MSAGILRDESTMHDIVRGDGDSYEIVNVRTGLRVAGETAATPTMPETTPPETTMATPPHIAGWLGTPTTVAGLPAVRYGTGDFRELQIAGDTIRSQWNAMVTADNPLGRTYVIIDVRDITTPELARAVAAAAAGYDDFDVYTVDDPDIPVGGYGCVLDFWQGAPDIVHRPDRLGGSNLR